MKVELIAPTVELHSEWIANLAEWGDTPQPGTAMALARTRGLNLRDADDFADWVTLLNAQPAQPITETAVPATNFWMHAQGRYLGAIQLRHALTELLREVGGHVGYSVRPSMRGHSIAARAVTSILPVAAAMGLTELLITCDENNTASRRTAESAGGRLTWVRAVDTYALAHGFPEPKCHYWIPTGRQVDSL